MIYNLDFMEPLHSQKFKNHALEGGFSDAINGENDENDIADLEYNENLGFWTMRHYHQYIQIGSLRDTVFDGINIYINIKMKLYNSYNIRSDYSNPHRPRRYLFSRWSTNKDFRFGIFLDKFPEENTAQIGVNWFGTVSTLYNRGYYRTMSSKEPDGSEPISI